jgi:AraC family transcriptional regulator
VLDREGVKAMAVGTSPGPVLSAEIKRGTATFKTQASWSRGRLYGAIKHWAGADPELRHRRQQHTFVLTLSGGTELTGTRISGSPVYEGRDGLGCVTFVPAGAERQGWYRNADMSFLVLLVDPDFVRSLEFGITGDNLRPFTNRRDPLLENVLWSLSREMRQADGGPPSLYAEHASGLAMCHVLRSLRLARKQTPGLSGRQLQRVLEFIEESLHRDVSLADLGALVGMGPDVFARHFKLHMARPPHRYLIERRIRRAELHLAAGNASIAEIALMVGFSSQSHFTTQFSRMMHMTPAAYRAQHR